MASLLRTTKDLIRFYYAISNEYRAKALYSLLIALVI